MWRNYLLVGIRSAFGNWTHGLINLVGLSIGLASCIIILLFVQQQQSYESWLPGFDRVGQLQTTMNDPNDGDIISAQASKPAAAALVDELPQVENSVALTLSRVLIHTGAERRFAEVYFVDPSFFKVFALPLVHGDPATALSRAGNVVLTESEARRLYGRTDVLGQTLTVNSRGQTTDLRVSGVLKDLPANSDLEFSILTPFDSEVLGANEAEFRSWSRLSGYVYARLRSPGDFAAVNAALPEMINRHVDRRERPHPKAFTLVPIHAVHLGGAREDSMRPAGDALAVSAFAAIAILILLIACMNFANLATAQSARRAREVALRKVLGARRIQIASQFIGEALVLTLAAMLLALSLVELAAPAFGAFMNAELKVTYLGVDGILPAVMFLWILVALVCGFYPAVLLSRFRPSHVLRSGRAEMEGSGRIRNILVIGQFAISITLIICTAVVYAQTSHARTVDPGFRQSGLLISDNMLRLYTPELQRSFTEQLRRIPGVTAVGRSSLAPGDDRQAAVPFTVPGRTEPVLLNLNYADWEFQRALGVPLLAGRFFEENRPLDDATVSYDPDSPENAALIARGTNVVITESAARRIGFGAPARAVGRSIFVPIRGLAQPVPATIIGVIGDAQLRSVRDRIRPAVYVINQDRYNHTLIRFSGVDPRRVRAETEMAWRQLLRNVPFEAEFAEDVVARFYDDDQARGWIFGLFSGLAAVISCLGLFGLAAFTAQRRTKEIGIRKVFGARTMDIMKLLVWQFSELVLVANLIAWPIAWWLMRDWLNGFAYRIPLHPGWFVGAGFIALAIAIVTIAGHAFKVARANPIHALRYE